MRMEEEKEKSKDKRGKYNVSFTKTKTYYIPVTLRAIFQPLQTELLFPSKFFPHHTL